MYFQEKSKKGFEYPIIRIQIIEFIKVDKNFLEKAKALGTDINSFIEKSTSRVVIEIKRVLRPGFEPGSPARKAGMIGRATPPELVFPLDSGEYISLSLVELYCVLLCFLPH